MPGNRPAAAAAPHTAAAVLARAANVIETSGNSARRFRVDELEAQLHQEHGDAGLRDALGQPADEQEPGDLPGVARIRGYRLQFRHHRERGGGQQQHGPDVAAG